jgi:protocatechuate 3,4-dioxygenase beta subunit
MAETDVERGGEFIDNRTDPNVANDTVDPAIPKRVDLTSDSEGDGGTEEGVPLRLSIRIGQLAPGGVCAPLYNAQVDLWSDNAQGIYSGLGTEKGRNFLRGYQITDRQGAVEFVTLYPGWTPGRAVHVSIKVRVFDGLGQASTEATTELFFQDAVSDVVFSKNAAYGRPDSRDTRNEDDPAFKSQRPPLVVKLSGDPVRGYAGKAFLGVRMGSVFGG